MDKHMTINDVDNDDDVDDDTARFRCHLKNTHSFAHTNILTKKHGIFLWYLNSHARSLAHSFILSLSHSLWRACQTFCHELRLILLVVIMKYRTMRLLHFTLFCTKWRHSCQASMHAHLHILVDAVNKLLTVQCHTIINQREEMCVCVFLFFICCKYFYYFSNGKIDNPNWISNYFSFLWIFSGPKNYNGLLLRAEVLYRLGHFRSSLADAENAIKCQPTSYNVSYNDVTMNRKNLKLEFCTLFFASLRG